MLYSANLWLYRMETESRRWEDDGDILLTAPPSETTRIMMQINRNQIENFRRQGEMGAPNGQDIHNALVHLKAKTVPSYMLPTKSSQTRSLITFHSSRLDMRTRGRGRESHSVAVCFSE